jgi:hypothetical protein
MSGTMAGLWGDLLLEQWDMGLQLNMAKITRYWFSYTTMKGTQSHLNQPSSKVREEMPRCDEFDEHKTLYSMIEEHLFMVHQNHMPRLRSYPWWHLTESAFMQEAQRHWPTSPQPTHTAHSCSDSRGNAWANTDSAWNTAHQKQEHFWSSMSRNHQFDCQ